MPLLLFRRRRPDAYAWLEKARRVVPGLGQLSMFGESSAPPPVPTARPRRVRAPSSGPQLNLFNVPEDPEFERKHPRAHGGEFAEKPGAERPAAGKRRKKRYDDTLSGSLWGAG